MHLSKEFMKTQTKERKQAGRTERKEGELNRNRIQAYVYIIIGADS